MTIDKAGLRSDVSGLIQEWGVQCTVKRYSSTLNSAGRRSGAFATKATETMWLQPVTGQGFRFEKGIDETTTHLVFQKHGGFDMQAEDQLIPTGETFELDVVAVHVKESHRFVEATRTKRT